MNDADPGVYHDISLLNDQSQIRLLRLEPCPRDVDAEVQCTLILATLQDTPDFEALSYAWGDQQDRKSILLNGCEFKVTRNLESALRNLRRKELPRLLWVDAICINQNDTVERSSQVAMMHDIYQTALRTVSWLGEAGEDGELALDFLYWYAKRKADLDSSDVDGHDVEYEKQGWCAVTALLRRPYWRRLWVMQEISFSQVQPRICCGTKRIQWGTLILALKDGKPAYYIKRLNRVRGATKELIRQGSKDRPSRNGRHVIFLLSHSAGFETSEPKDRVYALYGLMRVAGIVDFKPDYSKSETEVYQQITEFVLKMKNSLNLLEMRSYRQEDNLPSWVIDFSKPPPKSFPKFSTASWERVDEEKQLAIPEMSIDSNTNTLIVTGSVVDTVVSVHPVPPCLATAFRRAAEDPDAKKYGKDSLRSSHRAASLYWEELEDESHSLALCQNLISYISAFKEIVALFCRGQQSTTLPDWYPGPRDWEHFAEEARDCTNPSEDDKIGDFDTSGWKSLQCMFSTLSLRMHGRSCFRTSQGFVGAALAGVKPGDEIVAFQSTKQLHVLRSRGNDNHQYAGAAVLVAPESEVSTAVDALHDRMAGIRSGESEEKKFCIR